jgi:hypothetical protein
MLRSRLIGLIALGLIAVPAFAQDKAGEKAAAKHGPKLVKIVHVDTGKVLAVADSSLDDEAAAVLVKDEPAKDPKDSAQDKKAKAAQWRIEKNGEDWKIANRNSGKVLDVSGFSTEEGTVIIQYGDKPDSEGNDNQRWLWVEVAKTDAAKSDAGKTADAPPAADASKTGEKTADASPEGRIKSKSSKLVLDADSDGTIVQRASSDRSKSQLWRIVAIKEEAK